MCNKLLALTAAMASLNLAAMRVSADVIVRADGWQTEVASEAVSVATPADGEVDFVFEGTAFPESSEGIVVPTAGGEPSAFIGNYSASSVSAVSFAITSSGEVGGKATRLILRSGTRCWYNYNVGTQGGENHNRVGLSLSDGWVTSDPAVTPDTAESAWSADLQDVQYIGLAISKKDARNDQTFKVSSFSLESAAGSANPLSSALQARFGAQTVDQVTAVDAAVDTDGDGLTDLYEIRVMFDPSFFRQNFRANAANTAQGFGVSWLAVEGKRYEVLRAKRTDSVFEPVYTVTARTTGFELFVDSESESCNTCFYRVVQQP